MTFSQERLELSTKESVRGEGGGGREISEEGGRRRSRRGWLKGELFCDRRRDL